MCDSAYVCDYMYVFVPFVVSVVQGKNKYMPGTLIFSAKRSHSKSLCLTVRFMIAKGFL